MPDVTQLLQAVENGDAQAAEDLLPLVYDELRRLAQARLNQERPGQTLQATALVHDAWLRLIDNNTDSWSNRYHFFSAAAEAMRRILIDNARRKQRPKHGGDLERVDLDQVNVAIDTDSEILLQINEALDLLAKESTEKAELVKLRYFAGLTIPDAAKMLNQSESTAKRNWVYARAFLMREIKRLQTE